MLSILVPFSVDQSNLAYRCLAYPLRRLPESPASHPMYGHGGATQGASLLKRHVSVLLVYERLRLGLDTATFQRNGAASEAVLFVGITATLP